MPPSVTVPLPLIKALPLERPVIDPVAAVLMPVTALADKASVPLSEMVPRTEPLAVALPISSVPAVIVVPPV